MVILATFIGACLGFVACAMYSTGKSADCSLRIRGAAWIDFPPSSEPIPAELLK